MIIKTVKQVKSDFEGLMNKISQYHEPAFIIGKNNNAVMVSKEDWETIQKNLHSYSANETTS